MRITQGTFSYLPDFTDEEITAQISYALDNDWPLSVEFTDDPHPRNVYWEMWGLPMFDLKDAAGVLLEVNACRSAYPNAYIRLNAYDARPRSPNHRVFVHRAKAGRGTRLPTRPRRGLRPAHRLQHLRLRHRKATRATLRITMINASIPAYRQSMRYIDAIDGFPGAGDPVRSPKTAASSS